EAIAAGGARVPDSVRDAVLARAARLAAGARALLDAVAVAPPRAELWLLEELAAGELAHLEECLASGILRAERDAIAFRHEIARVAVEEMLPPDRRLSLHRGGRRRGGRAPLRERRCRARLRGGRPPGGGGAAGARAALRRRAAERGPRR